MKILFLVLLTLIIFTSCEKEGEIKKVSGKEFIINGKPYRFYRVVPADNYRAVWLLIPTDSSQLPVITKSEYTTHHGKSTQTHEIEAIVIP